jgi:hypothetical protein
MKLRVAKWEAKDGNELSANGLIRLNPNKPEFGSLMLISSTITLSGGFANRRNKVGFIVGNVEDLEAMIKEYNLREGSDYSQAVAPHRIVTQELVESEVPENRGYREKINPTTNEVLTKDGEPIYWKTEVVSEGSDIQDTLIQHDVETEDASQEEFQTAEQSEETK